MFNKQSKLLQDFYIILRVVAVIGRQYIGRFFGDIYVVMRDFALFGVISLLIAIPIYALCVGLGFLRFMPFWIFPIETYGQAFLVACMLHIFANIVGIVYTQIQKVIMYRRMKMERRMAEMSEF